ncbi:hypothetical protein ATI61_110388 [Archangium gephyra]|uniref:Uncharacterized protein n=1 Tax=Archangium gephyra TaxID=48 RepID=A0AAC8TH78_9BACT|nr:hypothetical protein [Archangium gephyra]AKJ05863.1 Hypothetical protein AA314_07489 [Archangium gephyra]REG27381.1 hypothetical protein ATI61_110388 [Archangium gephyra]
MRHMPYERMSISDGPEDSPNVPDREAPEEKENGPKRTPNAAEGTDGEERRMPQAEPGPTPGSAEGGAFDEPSRH